MGFQNNSFEINKVMCDVRYDGIVISYIVISSSVVSPIIPNIVDKLVETIMKYEHNF